MVKESRIKAYGIKNAIVTAGRPAGKWNSAKFINYILDKTFDFL